MPRARAMICERFCAGHVDPVGEGVAADWIGRRVVLRRAVLSGVRHAAYISANRS